MGRLKGYTKTVSKENKKEKLDVDYVTLIHGDMELSISVGNDGELYIRESSGKTIVVKPVASNSIIVKED